MPKTLFKPRFLKLQNIFWGQLSIFEYELDIRFYYGMAIYFLGFIMIAWLWRRMSLYLEDVLRGQECVCLVCLAGYQPTTNRKWG